MSNPPSNWTRTALTGRIRVISSNLGAGQYICRNVGARNNLKTCDEYEDALKVRIAPADDTVILECPVSAFLTTYKKTSIQLIRIII